MDFVKLVLVTGTNGKTTTCEFARTILGLLNVRVASVGTLGVLIGDRRLPCPEGISSSELFLSFLNTFALNRTEVLLYEAYSAPLARGVWDCVVPSVGVITGFGRDHLDVHGSLQNYWLAKRRLFDTILPQGSQAVIGVCNDKRDELVDVCFNRGLAPSVVGLEGDVSYRIVSESLEGSELKIIVQGQSFPVNVKFFGCPMFHNLTCAIGVMTALGVTVEQYLHLIPDITPPCGRLELMGFYRGAALVVDYAHTPDALMALLKSMRRIAGRELCIVFGCGGDRDQGKRLEMGEIAAEFADKVFLTDDNPRSEDPASIRSRVREGCPNAAEIAGRPEAITAAVEGLVEGDVLVIAGKGHETEQIVGSSTMNFSDRAFAAALIDTQT